MQPMFIKIHVPRRAALSAKASVYGDHDHELSPDQIGELTTAEATALLRFEGQEAERLELEGYPEGPDLDFWPLIKSALGREVAKIEENSKRRLGRTHAGAALHRWITDQNEMPLLRETAQRGYDASSQYVFELAKRCADLDPHLRELAPPIITCTEQLDSNASFELRPSPSLFALTLESRLRVLLLEVFGVDKMAPDTRFDLSPVQRMTPRHGDPQTVVVVRISHPATSYGAAVVWSAEIAKALQPGVRELHNPTSPQEGFR